MSEKNLFVSKLKDVQTRRKRRTRNIENCKKNLKFKNKNVIKLKE